MNYNKQKGFGAVEIVLVVVFVSIIGFMGWRLWQAQQDINDLKDQQSSEKQAAKQTEQTNEVEKSDKALIASVVCRDVSEKALLYAEESIEISEDVFGIYRGGCAESEAETASGFVVYLKKTSGSWNSVTGGNGEVDCGLLETQGFPQTMIDTCQGPSFEL